MGCLIIAVAIIFIFGGNNNCCVYGDPSDDGYTSFEVGQYYEFNGIVKCANDPSQNMNNKPINDECLIMIVEEDSIVDDILHRTTPNEMGKFILPISSGFDDPPTDNLELFIAFIKCCGRMHEWNYDKWSPYLFNGTVVTYTIYLDKSQATYSKN